MTYEMTVNEFVEAIRPELEHQVDQMILQEPDLQDRLLLMRHRDKIVRAYATQVRIANLEHRLAEADARLRPRLVEN